MHYRNRLSSQSLSICHSPLLSVLLFEVFTSLSLHLHLYHHQRLDSERSDSNAYHRWGSVVSRRAVGL